MILPARGKRIPDTREAFEYLANLYEKELLRAKEENGKLKAENNRLRQKLSKKE